MPDMSYLQHKIFDIAVKALIVCGCGGVCFALCWFVWAVAVGWNIDLGIKVTVFNVVGALVFIIGIVSVFALAFIFLWAAWDNYVDKNWRE